MADLETQPGKESVAAFIKAIEDPTRRRDCQALNALMKRVTAKRPVLWGGNMVGFARYEYRYASGHEGAWFITGFSPRKRDLTVYVMNGFGAYDDLMKKLGRHRHSKSCLYLKRLDDVDLGVLEALITKSVQDMRARYGCS